MKNTKEMNREHVGTRNIQFEEAMAIVHDRVQWRRLVAVEERETRKMKRCRLVALTRFSTGQGKLGRVREFEWSGKGQGKIFFGKVRENENWCHQMSDF